MSLSKIIIILVVLAAGLPFLAGCKKTQYARAEKVWEELLKTQTANEEGLKADELGSIAYKGHLSFGIAVRDAASNEPVPVQGSLNGKKLAVTITLDGKEVPGIWHPKENDSIYAMMKE